MMTLERRSELRLRANTAECSYIGQCNSTKCPKHGVAALILELLDALDSADSDIFHLVEKESIALTVLTKLEDRVTLALRYDLQGGTRQALMDARDVAKLLLKGDPAERRDGM